MLDDHAAVHHRAVGGVGVLRVVGVDGVGVVGGHQEAVGDGGGAVPARGGADPVHHVAEEGAVSPLLGEAAHLLVVEEGKYREALALPGGQEALEAAVGALEVVQPGGGDELPRGAPDEALLPGGQHQVVTQDVLRGTARRLGHGGQKGPLLSPRPMRGTMSHLRSYL